MGPPLIFSKKIFNPGDHGAMAAPDVAPDGKQAIPTPGAGSKKLDFIHQLRTQRFSTQRSELENFFNDRPKEFEKFQAEARDKKFLEKHSIEWLTDTSKPENPKYTLKLNSRYVILQNMPFEMYWNFRNYQAQTIQKRLDSGPDETQKEYLNKCLALYKNVSIEVDPATVPPSKQQAYIKCDGKTLVSITTDNTDNKNNMIFKIDPSLKDQELDRAILLMIDQVTRQQERSMDNRLEIFGYENNPTIALRIYQLAILEGSRPEIHKDTLAAWQAKAANTSNPDERNKFNNALDFLKLSETELKSTDLNNFLAKQPQPHLKKK